ncbi:MAG: hypothetical protein EAZ37_03875 [Burkholderiales bacterium]|nr:MAG: hypothetical protein EAZ37_03875 [Burkholderiales bacterium]
MTFVSNPVQAQSASISHALIVQDNVALRAAPRDSANAQAQLWQGELVELRGERVDYVQVWDHKRERGGFVRASQLRRVSFAPTDADGLLSVLRFVKDTPGSEGLAFGYSAAWLKAASASQVNSTQGAEVLDAIGTAAERLARHASSSGMSKAQQEAASAQLDAAQRYGIRFESFAQDGMDAKMTVCYDGEVFARLLAMPAATAEQRARAVLALTRSDCEDPALALKKPLEHSKNQEWRASVIDKAETQGLPAYVANKVQMRRASLWSSVAYDRARSGKATAAQAAQRSLDALGAINKTELPEEDMAAFNDAVMRVNASRWAAVEITTHNTHPAIVTTAGSTPGETCVSMILGHATVAKRCTYGVVWNASFSLNREATAATLAVQPQNGWREMWVFRKQGGQWSIDVLVPAAVHPEVGYVELAGWVPGGQQMLVAREARGEGKYKRSYEVMDLPTLTTQRQASDPSILGAFQRWQQPAWKQLSVSLR